MKPRGRPSDAVIAACISGSAKTVPRAAKQASADSQIELSVKELIAAPVIATDPPTRLAPSAEYLARASSKLLSTFLRFPIIWENAITDMLHSLKKVQPH